MTTYHKYGVHLSIEQQKRIARAFQAHTPISITIRHQDLNGEAPLMLTQGQINKIEKAKAKGTGCRLNLSNKQIIKMKRDGGFLEFLAPIFENLLGGVATSLGNNLLSNLFGGSKSKKGKGIPSANAGPEYGVSTGKGIDYSGTEFIRNERMLPLGPRMRDEGVPRTLPYLPPLKKNIKSGSGAKKKTMKKGKGLYMLGPVKRS